MTRGVRESSSRGYVPLLLTVGGQPLDSLGFPAGVCASEAGVFGDATHRSHSSRPPSKGFSRPSKMEPRIHAMRANSGARRQIVRQQGRSVAKTREASPRYATSCRDLVRGAARFRRTRVKNGCRARNERPLQGSRASRAKVSSAEETRAFHEAWCASRSWSVATKALETARGPLEADDRRQRRYVTRAVGNKTPGSAPLTDRPKHARRRESPSDLVRTPQGDQLQEPHDT